MKSKDIVTYYAHWVDENGVAITRTPLTNPYSYDGHVIWRDGKNEEADDSVYSDRLSQWDYEQTKQLKLKHFGDVSDYYSHKSPKDIESFLRERLDLPNLKLIYIMEYCNQSNGYPYWRFAYKK